MPAFLWALAATVASFFITAAMMPKPQNAKPSGLESFDFPQTEEGTPQAVFFGDVWTEDWQVLWYGSYRVQPIYGKGKK